MLHFVSLKMEYNISVYINVKKYLVFCLVCLQMVAPFIHAHALGFDSFKQHMFHFHTDEVSNININSADNAISQKHVGENQIIFAIITVANGIKTDLADHFADDIALMAVLFSFVLLLFNFKNLSIRTYSQTTHYRRIAYSLYTSRAPTP